jgi:hypothetical protein
MDVEFPQSRLIDAILCIPKVWDMKTEKMIVSTTIDYDGQSLHSITMQLRIISSCIGILRFWTFPAKGISAGPTMTVIRMA